MKNASSTSYLLIYYDANNRMTNIYISFGSVYTRLFAESVLYTEENKAAAYEFIASLSFLPNILFTAVFWNEVTSQDMGGTELWSSLLSLSLLSQARSETSDAVYLFFFFFFVFNFSPFDQKNLLPKFY